MDKKAKKLLVCSGIAVTGVAAASYAITKYMVDLALNRKEPKSLEKMKKRMNRMTPDEEHLLLQLEEKGRQLEEHCTQRVEIHARDGKILVGHWYPCENPKRILLAMHGWRSKWTSDFAAIADFWHESGCSVLYVEQRGQNASGGDYMGFGMLERYDCLDWASWLAASFGSELPLYLSGISMGASTVLMASELELPENVHGIIADCGFTSTEDIWRHVMEESMHLSYPLHSAVANRLCRQKISVDAKSVSAQKALKNCSVPVLFIHGEEDDFVPVSMTYQNYLACAGPKRMLIVPGAGHGMSYIVDPERYEEAVNDFWWEFDNCRPKCKTGDV